MSFSNLLSIVRTEQEKDEFLARLLEYKEGCYRVRKRKKQLKERIFSPEQIKIMEKVLGERLELLTPSAVESFVKSVTTYLQNRPVIRLFLAFSPSQSLLAKILSRLEPEQTGALLDIRVDKSLIGGAVFEHEGRHFDYSLRRFLEDESV